MGTERWERPAAEWAGGAQHSATWDWASLTDAALCRKRAKRRGALPTPVPNPLYRTRPCRNWERFGKCRYGPRCQFAHGPEQLRAR